MEAALIIPDTHIPYHDKKSYQLMLDVGKHLKKKKILKEVIILGDYADFYAVNSHGKHPDMMHTLQNEVDLVIDHLWKLKALFPDQKMVFIQGNHEYRLERYLVNRAPELFGITDTKKILELDQMGFHYEKYGRDQAYKVLGTNLIARHEPISMGVNCALATLQKGGTSIIFGHTHRWQHVAINTLDNRTIRGYSCGNLINKKASVFGYMKNKDDWTQGFAVAYKEKKKSHVVPVMIEDHVCYFDSKRFSCK